MFVFRPLFYSLVVEIHIAVVRFTKCHYLCLVSFIIILFSQTFKDRPAVSGSPFQYQRKSIKPSTHNIWDKIVSLIHTPTSFSKYSSKSLRYLRNNKKTPATPPWFTPSVEAIGALNLPFLFTLDWVCVDKFRRVSITRPCHPSNIFFKNTIWRLTRSNAFEKSTKHTKSYCPKLSL